MAAAFSMSVLTSTGCSLGMDMLSVLVVQLGKF